MSASVKNALLLSGLYSMFVIGGGSAIFGPALPIYAGTFQILTATTGLWVSTLSVGCLGGVLGKYLKAGQSTPHLPLDFLVL